MAASETSRSQQVGTVLIGASAKRASIPDNQSVDEVQQQSSRPLACSSHLLFGRERVDLKPGTPCILSLTGRTTQDVDN